jgi:hypothetical protein
MAAGLVRPALKKNIPVSAINQKQRCPSMLLNSLKPTVKEKK